MIGRIIQDARISECLEQKQLAERLGVTQHQVSAWENSDSVTTKSLERIAEALGRKLVIRFE